MSKFKVKFKLEKLELEIEGERATVPEVTEALQRHMSSLLLAPAALAGGGTNGGGREKAITEVLDVTPTRRGKRRSSPRTASKTHPDGGETAINFQHDPAKWGNPQQAWSAPKKALWLLFVMKNQANMKEMSSLSIADTFNKHFRSSGAVKAFNLTRDLGTYKSKAPPWVGEDATQTPSKWYLTDEGEKVARKLVEAATGSAPATA